MGDVDHLIPEPDQKAFQVHRRDRLVLDNENPKWTCGYQPFVAQITSGTTGHEFSIRRGPKDPGRPPLRSKHETFWRDETTISRQHNARMHLYVPHRSRS